MVTGIQKNGRVAHHILVISTIGQIGSELVPDWRERMVQPQLGV